LALPVNVDLPLPVGLPVSYIPEQETRLRLYRRMADIRTLAEVDALADEFADRFGTPPEDARNLLYQVRLKLLAEMAGLSSITSESGQIVLRYPPLPEGINERNLPSIGRDARAGRNAYWLPGKDGWQERLLEALSAIIEACQPSC
jgi:transcription-repair coupling factor (superfamily II helicase)